MSAHLSLKNIRNINDTNSLKKLGVSDEAATLVFSAGEDGRRKIIKAIQNGEIGTGIDEIRKKVAAIKAKGKEK
jgi:hypothetical protein